MILKKIDFIIVVFVLVSEVVYLGILLLFILDLYFILNLFDKVYKGYYFF